MPKTSLSKILFEKSKEPRCFALPMFIFSLSHLRRYRLAMQLKKNIIVVKHEDFVFPEMSLLPDDMKPIVK